MYKTSRLIFFLLLVAAVLLAPAGHASAALVKCRTDPIFAMSNGDVLNITLDISADAIYVRNVTYVLHVPAGVTVSRVTFTAGGLGRKETFKVVQDNPAKTYTTDTVVTTQNTGRVAVIATTRLNSVYAKSASGYNGDHLMVTVIKP